MQSQPVYRSSDRHTYFFQIVNEQTAYWPKTRRKPRWLTAYVCSLRIPGGGDRNRTDDPLLAKQVLSQLSYTPDDLVVGLGGLEPPTPRLSSVCSNQLSYRPCYQDPGSETEDRPQWLVIPDPQS